MIRPRAFLPIFLVGLHLAATASCASTPLADQRSALEKKAQAYDVEILRDTWGVPHIFGKRDADCAYGLAWAHAEDDFRTIEDVLMATRGRLARVKGAKAAPTDYLVQLLQVWETVDENWPQLPAEVRALATGYADGFNHFAATHPQQVQADFLYPVTGKDVLAGFIFKTPLFFGLDKTLKELFREERARPLAARPFPRPEMPRGSNAMAVSRKRSDDDTTRLFINSHQPWKGPVTWYEAHLVSEEGLDVAGGTFPGAPLILHGFNRYLGWAFTVNRPDLIDVFVLEMNPENENQYRHDGKWVDLEISDAELEVNLFGFVLPINEPLMRSVHGPVIRRPHGVYALRYAGMGEYRQLEQWYRLNKATNFEQWRQAMALLAIPSFNVVYADAEGHVGYFYNARLPRRVKETDPSPPDYENYLPGDDPRLLWKGHVPFDKLPQVVDPQSGVVFNANHQPFLATVGNDNPRPQEYPPSVERRMTNRGLQLTRLFGGAGDRISKEELMAIKHNKAYHPQSTFAQARDQVKAMVFDEPDLQHAQKVLAQWDLNTNPENRSAALGVLTGYTLYQSQWDAFHKPDVKLGFEKAAARLKKHFGRVDPTWGEVNRLRRGNADLPLGGGPDTLRAVQEGDMAADGRHVGVVGDSLIILVEWEPDGNVQAHSVHQYGSATLDPDDPHFADQAPLFAQEGYKKIWLDKAEIEANLERRYRPGQ
jgi:penicillin amidase/acyl-homoserine-lactone acylase